MSYKSKRLKIIWKLEMLSIVEFNPVPLKYGCRVIKLEIPLPIINKFFYEEVGRNWYWTDRVSWSIDKWNKYVIKNNIQTWILLFHGTPAGYFEFDMNEKEIEIAYFGLLPQFLNKKLGAGFLSSAIEIAWEKKINRIWVHTCNFDHPNALNNYKARGFKVFNENKQIIKDI